VIEVVKGGLILDIGLRGFLPASLVEMRRVRDLQPYVGKQIEAKIIELDKNRNNVVLSRRAWLEQTQSEVRQTFLQTLQKGQVRSGVVSSIVNFGAFVDLGGVDGLVHVSELSWKHIDHPGEVVEVGQEVTVEVLDVDMDRERVSLSLKATQETRGSSSPAPTRSARSCRARSRSSCRSARSSGWTRASRAWCTSPSWPSATSRSRSRSCRSATRSSSRSSTSTSTVAASRSRSSRPTRPARAAGETFDPALYGMAAEYDEQGNYKYPEGFDPETNDWLEGYEKQREEWESQYAEAHARWEAHRKQIEEAAKAESEARAEGADTGGSAGGSGGGGGGGGGQSSYSSEPAPSEGTLATDEALAALREKLTGGM
jgi:small subunit ribosomal protein S1